MALNASAAEELPYVKIRALSMETANKAAMAAARHCSKLGYQPAVAVTDRYGNLVAFIRSPLSGKHTIKGAKNKAWTAATLQGSTEELGPQLPHLRGGKNFSLIGGGLAIRTGGVMYGAIGVAGAPGKKTPGDVDDECAKAGLAAIQEDLEFAQ
ncbi:MAG: hypothetical protein AMJ68_04880 [Acidithiobacillales bacterium SG8_45]|nr:MAG: hypothetical protein AMJ68_04880 [Acidithiobacillales bacterium SG8_45]